MTKEAEEKAKQLMNLRTVMLTSITSALAFVVGLFWNDAIKSAIERFVPQGQDLTAKFASAIIVTIVVVILVYILFHAQTVAERELSGLKGRIRKKPAEQAAKEDAQEKA